MAVSRHVQSVLNNSGAVWNAKIALRIETRRLSVVIVKKQCHRQYSYLSDEQNAVLAREGRECVEVMRKLYSHEWKWGQPEWGQPECY